jgi:hypothetical protein
MSGSRKPAAGIWHDRHDDRPPGATPPLEVNVTMPAGKRERETRYYLSSANLSADMFGQAVRGHRGIENRLHWLLDVVFREDLTRLRAGNALQNMAIVRHTALNLLSRPGREPALRTAASKPAGTSTIWKPSSDMLHDHSSDSPVTSTARN